MGLTIVQYGMRFFVILFLILAVVGLFTNLAVTLIAIAILPLIFFAEKKFKQMDEEWETKHRPIPTEKLLEDQTCNKM